MIVVALFWWGLFSWLYYDSWVMDVWASICFEASIIGCGHIEQFCSASGNVVFYTVVDEWTPMTFAFFTAIPFISASYRNND
jgi:hypothetical protein